MRLVCSSSGAYCLDEAAQHPGHFTRGISQLGGFSFSDVTEPPGNGELGLDEHPGVVKKQQEFLVRDGDLCLRAMLLGTETTARLS